jgi:glycosyltransferase involved in cell wall biosynthesis
MRVLWYSDVQLPEITGTPAAGGGWIDGLRRALETFAPEIELGIACPGPIAHDPLTVGNATYFHVPHDRLEGRAARVLGRWRHDPVPDGAVARCVAIARNYSPDLVHVHGAEHYFGLAIPHIDAPAVVSLQGIATVLQRFSFAGLRWSEILREVPTGTFASGQGPLHAAWMIQSRAAVERYVLDSCDDFLGRTEWDRNVLKVLRPHARYHEVGEALGEPFWSARWLGRPMGDSVLYCTGGASPFKGVECLLEALILIRRAGKSRPRLRLAGGVVDGFLARKIRSLLNAPELRGAVDLLGLCSQDQIATELAAASAFVLPSHMENSSNALCEAMLVGAPCIASFVGGVPSLVNDGVEGLLYHDADPFALAGKIDQLLSDPALAASLGANAKETARRRHDPKTVARQAADAYREVLERWRERRAECGVAKAQKGTP